MCSYLAWQKHVQEFYTIWRHVGCRDYYSNIARCAPDPAEDNYLEFCALADTRRALHVGALEFPNSGDVYSAMLESRGFSLEYVTKIQPIAFVRSAVGTATGNQETCASSKSRPDLT